MKTITRYLVLGAMLVTSLDCPLNAQQTENSVPPKKEQAAPPAAVNRLTIEVSGGDANKPVENASVYIRTLEEHAILKDKKTELNVKTNQQGIAHIPEPPLGRVQIQVVVPGWKPFGRWYDINDPKQVIKIHLERPPQWY